MAEVGIAYTASVGTHAVHAAGPEFVFTEPCANAALHAVVRPSAHMANDAISAPHAVVLPCANTEGSATSVDHVAARISALMVRNVKYV